MKDLRDKVAVVTGGASGIGLALVQAFVNEAMRVVIADVDPAALTAVEAQFADTDNVIVCATDVTDVASVTKLADTVFERFGACHVLCNNAGVGAPSAKVWQTTPNDWSWVFSVNLTGVVNGIHAFVPRMLASGEEGCVINTSSSDGPSRPSPPLRCTRPARRRSRCSPNAWRPSWSRRDLRSARRSSTRRADSCAPGSGPLRGPGRPSSLVSDPARPRP